MSVNINKRDIISVKNYLFKKENKKAPNTCIPHKKICYEKLASIYNCKIKYNYCTYAYIYIP